MASNQQQCVPTPALPSTEGSQTNSRPVQAAPHLSPTHRVLRCKLQAVTMLLHLFAQCPLWEGCWVQPKHTVEAVLDHNRLAMLLTPWVPVPLGRWLPADTPPAQGFGLKLTATGNSSTQGQHKQKKKIILASTIRKDNSQAAFQKSSSLSKESAARDKTALYWTCHSGGGILPLLSIFYPSRKKTIFFQRIFSAYCSVSFLPILLSPSFGIFL